MIEIRRMDPHDPVPEGPGGNLTVLRRFDEDEPRRTMVEIVLTTRAGEVERTRPLRSDGTPMGLKEAVEVRACGGGGRGTEHHSRHRSRGRSARARHSPASWRSFRAYGEA